MRGIVKTSDPYSFSRVRAYCDIAPKCNYRDSFLFHCERCAGFHNRFGHFPSREFATAAPPVAHACRDGLDPKLVIVVRSSSRTIGKSYLQHAPRRPDIIIILCIVTIIVIRLHTKNIVFTIWVVRVCFTSRGEPGLFQLGIKTTSLFQ